VARAPPASRPAGQPASAASGGQRPGGGQLGCHRPPAASGATSGTEPVAASGHQWLVAGQCQCLTRPSSGFRAERRGPAVPADVQMHAPAAAAAAAAACCGLQPAARRPLTPQPAGRRWAAFSPRRRSVADGGVRRPAASRPLACVRCRA
jgi:hypothetical protein